MTVKRVAVDFHFTRPEFQWRRHSTTLTDRVSAIWFNGEYILRGFRHSITFEDQVGLDYWVRSVQPEDAERIRVIDDQIAALWDERRKAEHEAFINGTGVELESILKPDEEEGRVDEEG